MSYEQCALKLAVLTQEELLKWLREYFRSGYDEFFGGALAAEFPSEALMDICKTLGGETGQSEILTTFRGRLEYAIAKLAIEYSPPFATAHGAQTFYQVATLVSEAKLSKGVEPIVKVVASGMLKKTVVDRGDRVDLHFLILRLLPEYYGIAPHELQQKIKDIVLQNSRDRQYTAVASAALAKIT